MISQQVVRQTLIRLVKENIISKRILLFYETFDIIKFFKILFTNPKLILLWITKMELGKWIILIIIVAL